MICETPATRGLAPVRQLVNGTSLQFHHGPLSPADMLFRDVYVWRLQICILSKYRESSCSPKEEICRLVFVLRLRVLNDGWSVDPAHTGQPVLH